MKPATVKLVTIIAEKNPSHGIVLSLNKRAVDFTPINASSSLSWHKRQMIKKSYSHLVLNNFQEIALVQSHAYNNRRYDYQQAVLLKYGGMTHSKGHK